MSDDMTCTFLLTDLDYKIKRTDTSPTIRLFGKTKEKSVLISITDFFPYFYITQKTGLEDFIKKNNTVQKWFHKFEKTKAKRYFGGEELQLLKIYGSHPEQTPTIRQLFVNAGFEIHEADMPFLKRFLLDLNIRSLNVLDVKCTNCIEDDEAITADTSFLDVSHSSTKEAETADHFYKLKIMAFDIEVDHENETIQQLIGPKNKRITAISYVWGQTQNDRNKKIFLLQEDSDTAEQQLIHGFLKSIKKIQPDMLITFNGDNFDFPYLLERMNRLGISSKLLSVFGNDDVYYSNNYRCYRIKGRIAYDLSPRTWGIHPLSGKKGLGDIAEVVLGRTKVELSRNTGVIWRSGFLEG
ncbi:MAG: 3'-5' exonuclease, partial [Candidatus Heimdallarchaeota archaeon]